jgi:hypothetical protein
MALFSGLFFHIADENICVALLFVHIFCGEIPDPNAERVWYIVIDTREVHHGRISETLGTDKN